MTNEKPASPTTTAKDVTEAQLNGAVYRIGLLARDFEVAAGGPVLGKRVDFTASGEGASHIAHDLRVILAALSLPASPTQGETQEYKLRAMVSNYDGGHIWDALDAKTVRKAADEIKALRSTLDRTTLPPTEEAAGASEQPDFTYYECPECGFDVIHRADYQCRSIACPICAGDSGHDVGMTSRPARSTDKPEGKDARLPAPQGKRT